MSAPSGRAAGMVVDAGGRPVTDEGGRPVFRGDGGQLQLDDTGTPPAGAVTATGTDSGPVPEPTPYVDEDAPPAPDAAILPAPAAPVDEDGPRDGPGGTG